MFDFGQICCNFIANSRCSIPPEQFSKMLPKLQQKGPQVLELELLKSSKNFWDL